MKKILAGTLCLYSLNAFAYDTNPEDPLFFGNKGDILSSTSVKMFDSIIDFNEYISWTAMDQLSVYLDMTYRNDMDNSNDGFSGPKLGLKYRIADDGVLMYDLLGNIRISGSNKIDDFEHTVYSFGFRGGMTKNIFTLAGTLSSSWIFDGDNGYSWIDFIPEGQIRFIDDWSSNLSFTFRKATISEENDIIGNLSINKVYGRTQYIGYVGYSFQKDKDIMGGIKLNILF